MRALLLQLRREALRVRRAAEHLAPALGYARTLAGFCPLAAAAVTEAVTPLLPPDLYAVLVAGFYEIIPHFWTELRRGARRRRVAVIDVTASQFRSCVRVRVVPSDSPAADRYLVREAGARAASRFYLEDADLLRVLPPRWWEVAEDPAATLDARVLAVLRRHDPSDTGAIARQVEASPREVLGSLGRLAARPAIYGLRQRAA